MALNDLISQTRHAISEYGVITGSRLTTQKIIERAFAHTGSVVNYGFRPLESDWDVLLILDACRADLFREFAPYHPVADQFESISSKYSCASTSREWFDKSFGEASDDAVKNVHYISQNPYLSRLDLNRFHSVEKLYEAGSSNGQELLTPETVTNISLQAYHDSSAESFIVHYLPPHAPFLHCREKYNLKNKSWGGESHDVWFGLQIGAFDEDEVWQDYGENLRTVLDEVERMLNYVSGDVVITADHANAMGEFGIYGHPGYVPLPSLKRVPWVQASGQGEEIDPNSLESCEMPTNSDTSNIDSRLEALGYKQ